MAELLKSDLKLDKNEILRIRKTGGSKNSSTIKIQTVADIVVAERFGEHVEFQRQFGEIKWTCSIRGGNKGSRLRFLNGMSRRVWKIIYSFNASSHLPNHCQKSKKRYSDPNMAHG